MKIVKKGKKHDCENGKEKRKNKSMTTVGIPPTMIFAANC